MLQTGLEFAPGTTDDCKKMIARLFKPTEILGAYRHARASFKTGDLVMVGSEADPSGFNVEPRTEYLKRLRVVLGAKAPRAMMALGITHKSAHSVVKLPFEADAMWLIVTRGKDMPIMAVLFAAPYEMTAAAAAN